MSDSTVIWFGGPASENSCDVSTSSGPQSNFLPYMSVASRSSSGGEMEFELRVGMFESVGCTIGKVLVKCST
jgi:hypothetical protein